MFGDEFLRLLLPRHEAVLVENHLHPIFPELPGVGRDVLVDALPELARPGRRIEPRQFLLKLLTKHLAPARVSRGGARRSRFAGVSHVGIVPSARPDRSSSAGVRAPLGVPPP